jgi:zinc protease
LPRASAAGASPWPGPAGYVRAPQPLVAVASARLQELTPDRQNANLRGALALPLGDADADYPAVLMANYLFGSGGASRLWRRIREGDGLSYDVRSVIDWNPFEPHSSWTVSAIFAPQNQPRVEAALREEVARSIADGFHPGRARPGADPAS